MDLRLTLYAWSACHGLSAHDAARLDTLAGLQQAPESLARRLVQGVAVLAAAFGRLGVMLWLAANWFDLGHFGRFAMLEGMVLLLGLGAFRRLAWRTPLSLAVLLCAGALFAYFGHTYPTGSESWQLFAVWAALTLPLCLGARSDVVWIPWALAVVTAIAFWVYARTGNHWLVERTDRRLHLAAWCMVMVLSAALSPIFKRWTGAGVWAWNLGVTLFAVSITASALGDLLSYRPSGLHALGLLPLGGAAVLLIQDRFFDVYALSVVALALNIVLVLGLGHVLFHYGSRESVMGNMFLLGLCAVGLLAGSVATVRRGVRRQAMALEGQA